MATAAYTIMNCASQMYLEIPGDLNLDDVAIVQWDWNEGYPPASMIWSLDVDNPYTTIQNCVTQKVMDVPGNETVDDLVVMQYDANGGQNQQWTFIPVSVGENEGTYQIKNVQTGKMLEIPGGIPQTAIAAIQNDASGVQNQNWLLMVNAPSSKQ